LPRAEKRREEKHVDWNLLSQEDRKGIEYQMAHLHYFHAVVIALQKELQMHPDLRDLSEPAHTFEELSQ